MPRIPTYQPQEQLPSPSLLTQKPVVQLVPQTGEAVTQLGQALEAITQKFIEANRTTEFNKQTVNLFKDFESLEQKYSIDTDFATIPERYQSDVESLKEKYESEITDNIVWRAFEPEFDKTAIRKSVSINSIARKGIIDEGIAQLDLSENELLRMAIDSEDPDDIQAIANRYLISLAGAQAAGFIDGEERGNRERKFLDRLTYNMARNDIMKADTVEEVEEIINNLDAYSITPEHEVALESRAQTKIKSLLLAEERKEKERDRESLENQKRTEAGLWSQLYRPDRDLTAAERMAMHQIVTHLLETRMIRPESADEFYRALRSERDESLEYDKLWVYREQMNAEGATDEMHDVLIRAPVNPRTKTQLLDDFEAAQNKEFNAYWNNFVKPNLGVLTDSILSIGPKDLKVIADAYSDFYDLVFRSNMQVREAAQFVVDKYRGHQEAEANRMELPINLKGGIATPQTLDEAEKKTIEDMKANLMGEDEGKAELEKIGRWSEYLKRMRK